MKKILSIVAMLTVAVAMQAFDGAKYYVINRNGNADAYMYADGTSLKTGTLNASDASYIWQLIPTATADGYYLKNVGTEQYVQTSRISLSTSVSMGDSEIEYIVSTGAGTTGTGTTYFLASNDQGTIDYTTDGTLGLNFGSTGVVAYYIKTGRGNSYWNITETDYNPSPEPTPEPISGEDEDVCTNVKAYRLPCGTYKSATKLTKIGVTGDGVLSSLSFAPATGSRYTIYTRERAVVMPGKVDVTATLTGATTSGLVVTVCADFDGDGQFEESVQPKVAASLSAELTVPATAKACEGRIRIRVDQGGNVSPNGDITGTLYDLPVYVREAKTTRTLTVKPNSTLRGTVSIEGSNGSNGVVSADFAPGTEVTVSAKNLAGYKFSGWQLGQTVISTDKTCTVTMDEDKTLTAMFSPKNGAAIDGEYIMLNFDRSETPVKVTAVDQNDNEIAGVTATYTGTTSMYKNTATWNKGAAVSKLDDITSNLGSTGTERNFPFAITGIPAGYYVEKISAEIAATTATGAYQGKTVSRDFTYTVQTGAASDALAEFASTTGDINVNSGSRTLWSMVREDGSIEPGDPFYLNLQLVNNATLTCCSSVFSIVLHKSDKAPTGIEEVQEVSSPEGSSSFASQEVQGSDVYDMSGRKVWKAEKGVFIQNGNKVIK